MSHKAVVLLQQISQWTS